MKIFTELQSLILAALEEAGEDHLSALINTVVSRNGSIDEIDAISTALAGLIEGGLLRIARSRDKDSLRWIALRKDESLAPLSSLKSFLQWSSADRLWKWQESFPRLEVLLTPAGIDAAQQILHEHGRPPRQSH